MVIILHFPAGDISEAISAVRVEYFAAASVLACSRWFHFVHHFSQTRRPLQQMNRAALELAHGDFTTRVPVTSQDEVGQLATSFNFMVDKLGGVGRNEAGISGECLT